MYSVNRVLKNLRSLYYIQAEFQFAGQALKLRKLPSLSSTAENIQVTESYKSISNPITA